MSSGEFQSMIVCTYSGKASFERAISRRAAAGRAQLLAKRGRTGRMQFPEKTAGIPDGSGWFGMVRDFTRKKNENDEILVKFR